MEAAENKKSQRRPRWHLLYFVLAGFDLLTVGLGLALSHHLMTSYESSVRTNEIWAGRTQAITELSSLAQAANAPGNDVFDSRDVVNERARRDAAVARFDVHMNVIVAELERSVAIGEREQIALALSHTRLAMTAMLADADLIFSYFERGMPAAAGRYMATMDRKYGNLTTAISAAINAVQDQQVLVLQGQVARAEQLKVFEYIIFFCIVAMVIGVAFYGHKISQLWRGAQETETRRLAAEAANAAKSNFLAHMSHELRTPLNAIIGYSEMLREDHDDGSEAGRDLDRITGAGRHLLSLVNETLDWSKIEAGRIDLHGQALNPIVAAEEVIAIMSSGAEKSGSRLVRVGASTALLAWNDEVRLRQCLLNLVSNACKFTKHGLIEIEVRRAGDDLILFEVRDTGIGMNPEQLARVFEPYTQADASIAREYGGTGLGLPIARQLARAMGGDLIATSAPGTGSCFSLTIAADLSAHVPAKPAAALARAAAA